MSWRKLNNAEQKLIRDFIVVPGLLVEIPTIDPKLYASIKDILEFCEIRWHKQEKRHRASKNTDSLIKKLIEDGKYWDKKKANQAFYTMDSDFADFVAGYTVFRDIDKNTKILEPSAGHGHLLDAVTRAMDWLPKSQFYAYELDPDACDVLEDKGYPNVKCCDFLETEGKQDYQYIFMNPPFSNDQDCKHIIHAYENFLCDGGWLTAICSTGWAKANIRTKTNGWKFRLHELVYSRGLSFEESVKDKFKEAGTSVSVSVIALNKYHDEGWEETWRK